MAPPPSIADGGRISVETPLDATRMQRVRGSGLLSVKQSAGRSRIDRLFQEGAAKIRIPRLPSRALEAVAINTAGGLTGGDHLDWCFQAGAETALTITTQACEKNYKAQDGTIAKVDVRLALETEATLSWMPQETILFERSALLRTLQADMASDARLLMCEPVIFGRAAMGETVRRGLFRDCWRVRMNGQLIHAENFAIGPQIGEMLPRTAVSGSSRAFATVLLIAPDAADLLARARQVIGSAGGVSAWTVGSGQAGKLLARLSAEDGYSLRKTLVPLLRLLNGEAGVPKIWSI